MALFLVQHGLSLPKDRDPEKGLSPDGIADTERIAGVAKGYAIHVSGIGHSGKKRAVQTAEIFAKFLEPARGAEKISGINPMDDVGEFAKTANSKDDLMLVGHLPFMEKLTAYLTTGSAEKPVFKFQNSGIVCLYEEPDIGWVIKWTLMPIIK